ncbi:hypothetical protein F503_08795 [Ophiostoma piceae UAMH 11346]|uniref:Uncharacterized protein n=1 Tax=Ophiostoma piceae (strain UAMH 11346) TaxID=1262450 RepID=S3C9N1_OPHP1|nr:hypothetical protein F503_08795 [Ophiostoma piceae UAMH 11346]
MQSDSGLKTNQERRIESSSISQLSCFQDSMWCIYMCRVAFPSVAASRDCAPCHTGGRAGPRVRMPSEAVPHFCYDALVALVSAAGPGAVVRAAVVVVVVIVVVNSACVVADRAVMLVEAAVVKTECAGKLESRQ